MEAPPVYFAGQADVVDIINDHLQLHSCINAFFGQRVSLHVLIISIFDQFLKEKLSHTVNYFN